MADFDPDQYLKETTTAKATGFDPDQYLKETASPTPMTSTTRAYTDNLANGATLGYVPQMVGKITEWLSPSKEDLEKNVRADIAAKPDKYKDSYNPYLTGRDTAIDTLNREQAEHPTASTAGTISGAVGSAIVTPTPGALIPKTVAGGLVKGAVLGGTYGAASNPGDVEGQIDPYQWSDRLHNTAKGALIGGIAGGASMAIQKGLTAAAENAPGQALSASGAMKKDFLALEGQNRSTAIGQFALDNGIVKAGDHIEDVSDKAQAMMKNAGGRLDQIYSDAASKASNEVPGDIGFNPARDKDQILSQIESKLKGTEGKSATVQKIGNYLDELTTDYGNKVLDPKTANEIEGKISDKVNWYRNPNTQDPNSEIAMKTMRKFVSDRVDSHIAYLSADPSIADKLASANKDYGYAATIARLARDKMARLSANAKVSLGDVGGAGVGAMAGAAAGHEDGSGKDAILGALALGVLHHYGKLYAPGALAQGMNAAGKMAPLASKVFNPQTSAIASKAAATYGTTNSQTPEEE